MAYTDKAGKTIIDAFGKFQAVLYAACVVGDLLARDTSNEGFILADDSTGIVASAVALEDGAAGETIWMALAAVIETPPTETNGVFTDNALAVAADVMDTLYLGESGKVEDSAGTTPQVVGFIISTTRIVLTPNTYITGTDQTLSGNMVVGGTLSVTGTTALTGAATITGAIAANGGITVASGKNLTMTKGYIIETPTSVSDDATVAGGVYVVDTSVKDVNITLPAAAAGLKVKAVCTSATKQLTVTAGSGDKVINASGAAKDSVKGNAAAYNNITLYAVDATNWITLGFQGTWTYS